MYLCLAICETFRYIIKNNSLLNNFFNNFSHQKFIKIRQLFEIDGDHKILKSTLVFVTMRIFGLSLRGPDELYRFNLNNSTIDNLHNDSC